MGGLKMKAKQLFENLGYKLKVSEKNRDSIIQYVNKAKEMDSAGSITSRYIEFYLDQKVIVIYITIEHENGNTSKGDSGVLNFEEYNAIRKQVDELEW